MLLTACNVYLKMAAVSCQHQSYSRVWSMFHGQTALNVHKCKYICIYHIQNYDLKKKWIKSEDRKWVSVGIPTWSICKNWMSSHCPNKRHIYSPPNRNNNHMIRFLDSSCNNYQCLDAGFDGKAVKFRCEVEEYAHSWQRAMLISKWRPSHVNINRTLMCDQCFMYRLLWMCINANTFAFITFKTMIWKKYERNVKIGSGFLWEFGGGVRGYFLWK